MAKPRAWLLVGLFAAASLAGCLDSGDPLEPLGDGLLDAPTGPNDLVRPPSWQLGDWWTYRQTHGGPERTVTLRVVEEADGTLMVWPDDWRIAIEDSITNDFWIGAFVGGGSMQLNDNGTDGWRWAPDVWTDGATWNASADWIRNWRDFQYTAQFFKNITVGEERHHGYKVVVRSPTTTSWIEYLYVPELEWFYDIVLILGGRPFERWELVDHGNALDPDALTYRASAERILEWHSAFYVSLAESRIPAAKVERFQLDDRSAGLWLRMSDFSHDERNQNVLQAPDGTEYRPTMFGTEPGRFIRPQPGEWLAYQQHLESPSNMSMRLHAVWVDVLGPEGWAPATGLSYDG